MEWLQTKQHTELAQGSRTTSNHVGLVQKSGILLSSYTIFNQFITKNNGLVSSRAQRDNDQVQMFLIEPLDSDLSVRSFLTSHSSPDEDK